MASTDMPRPRDPSKLDMSPRREAAASQAHKLLTKAEEQLDLIGPIPRDVEVPQIVGKIRKQLETLHDRFVPRKAIRLENSQAKEKRPKHMTRGGRENEPRNREGIRSTRTTRKGVKKSVEKIDGSEGGEDQDSEDGEDQGREDEREAHEENEEADEDDDGDNDDKDADKDGNDNEDEDEDADRDGDDDEDADPDRDGNDNEDADRDGNDDEDTDRDGDDDEDAGDGSQAAQGNDDGDKFVTTPMVRATCLDLCAYDKPQYKNSSRLKKARAIISKYYRSREFRTRLDFLFSWTGQNNITEREFEGLCRIVGGYFPIDAGDRRDLEFNRRYIKQFRINNHDLSSRCEAWSKLDSKPKSEQNLIALELDLSSTEQADIGVGVLSGILYRTRCIKVARLIEQHSRGRGGQAWVVNFYKTVFEKKRGFYSYTKAEKAIKWKNESVVEEYEKEKRENRYLVQSRNRLLHLYDLFGVAAILDPSFNPGRRNTGCKNFAYWVDRVIEDIAAFERSLPLDSEARDMMRVQRSRDAEEITLFVGQILGGEVIGNYLKSFFAAYPPAISVA